MSDEYTNMDLETAEQILLAAGHGEIARALKYQTHGNRNLIQGEWGTKVVNAFEKILQVQVVSALAGVQSSLDQQHDLIQQILAAVNDAQKTARRALAVSKENGRGLKKLQGEVNDLRGRLDNKRLELDDIHAWQREVDAQRLAYPPEEIRELVDYVRRKKAEDEAGDGPLT